MMRFSQLRRTYDDDPDHRSDTSRDIVPMSTSVSARNLSEVNESDSDPRKDVNIGVRLKEWVLILSGTFRLALNRFSI